MPRTAIGLPLRPRMKSVTVTARVWLASFVTIAPET